MIFFRQVTKKQANVILSSNILPLDEGVKLGNIYLLLKTVTRGIITDRGS